MPGRKQQAYPGNFTAWATALALGNYVKAIFICAIGALLILWAMGFAAITSKFRSNPK